MTLSLRRARGYKISATDGILGKASDFFFDDAVWTIRYLVVDTGWLLGRKILIAPESVRSIDGAGRKVFVSLDKRQIEDGPGIGTDLPVSRQEEMALREHYGWPKYWEVYAAGIGKAPMVPPLNTEEALGSAPRGAEQFVRRRSDPHLRSADEVTGYHIEARDGEIGHIEDVLVDDEEWTVRYLVVDTRNWLPGRTVLVPPASATGIDWASRVVTVDLDRDAVKESLEYAPYAHQLERGAGSS